MDEPRTWYYDDENTHGVDGLVDVTDEFHEPNKDMLRNAVGVGPDHEFHGTVAELIAHLRRPRYTQLETDVPELQAAWNGEPSAIQQARDWVAIRKQVRKALIDRARHDNQQKNWKEYLDAEGHETAYGKEIRKLYNYPSDLSEERLLKLIKED